VQVLVLAAQASSMLQRRTGAPRHPQPGNRALFAAL